ncbi:MAG: ROK family transcriptional regulator [Spirochaetes bacterium]|nr:ROK family transcriptional regulator [Spirochaetota bacterium]
MKTLKISRAANANLQNKINMSVVFNYLREHEPTYRARISRDLNISAPAVSRIVDKLIEDGYVVETEKLKIHSGKRPTQLRINANKCNVIGVDLVKERIKIAISDFSGRIISTYQGCRISEGIDIGGALIDEIEKALARYRGERKIDTGTGDLKAIGVGVPAVIDIDTGWVTEAPLYDSLRGVNLRKILSERFDIPIFVENVVKLSALGEKHYGQGRNHTDIVFIEVSNGIGAGIIVDNHLIRGTNGSAGEIGLSIIGRDNLRYKTTSKGYLEKNASVEAIVEKARREVAGGDGSLLQEAACKDPSELTPSAVCRAANGGNETAKRIINGITESLSLVTVNLILILNPQIIVFGGDICSLPGVERLFLDPIREAVSESIPFCVPKITMSSLRENAGVVGASFLAIESLLLGEFPYAIDFDLLG